MVTLNRGLPRCVLPSQLRGARYRLNYETIVGSRDMTDGLAHTLLQSNDIAALK